MSQSKQKQNPQDKKHSSKKQRFCINDHMDVLVEIFRRLDGRSLSAAACVCRLWRAFASSDSIWEDICFRHVSPPPPSASLRPVVSALGGYRRLYMVCVRPVLNRLQSRSSICHASGPAVLYTGHQVQLSLSLFCIDYYERLCLGGARLAGDATSASASSLMFLLKPVNVV